MKLLQKLIFIFGIILATIYFIYTLSFSTGWALGEGKFGAFYRESQEVNKLIFKWALWTVIFAGCNIIFHSHKNRNFYLLNYISTSLFSITLLCSGVITMTKVPPLKEAYLNLNQGDLEFITKLNYSKISTSIFDYGVVISVVLIVEAILVIGITLYKMMTQIKRAKIKKLGRLENAHGNI